MKKVALFDLDHTLIPMDSDFQWGEFTLALGWCDSTEFKRCNTEFYEHYKAGTLDIHAYVRFATLAMRQQGAVKAAEAHAAFMQTVVKAAIRPQALALVRDHQAAGGHRYRHQRVRHTTDR
jgi:phosphoserine phosphatase